MNNIERPDISIDLKNLVAFTPEEASLLTEFADILPGYYVVPDNTEQREGIVEKHKDIVQKCLDAGLARTITDINKRFLEGMNQNIERDNL